MSMQSKNDSYPIKRVKLTSIELRAEESKLSKEFGSLDELRLKHDTLGLTIAEHDALNRLHSIRFLLGQ